MTGFRKYNEVLGVDQPGFESVYQHFRTRFRVLRPRARAPRRHVGMLHRCMLA